MNNIDGSRAQLDELVNAAGTEQALSAEAPHATHNIGLASSAPVKPIAVKAGSPAVTQKEQEKDKGKTAAKGSKGESY